MDSAREHALGNIEALLTCLHDAPETSLSAAVMTSLGAALAARAVLVFAVGASDRLELIAEHGVEVRIPGLSTMALDEPGIASRTARTGAPTRSRAGVGELSAPEEQLLFLSGQPVLRAVPLSAHRVVTGVLVFTVGSDAEDRIAGVVASALSLALAHTTAKRAATAVHAKLERTIFMMHELASKLARQPVFDDSPDRTFDVRSFFKLLAEHARDLVGAELAAIGMAHGPNECFDPWVAVGIPDEMVAAIGRVPRPVGTLGKVAIVGETLRVHDVHEHPSFAGLPAGHIPVRGLLAVPVRVDDETLGNLYLANKRGGAEFDDSDERTIEMFAAVAASGLRLSMLLGHIEADRTRLAQIIDAEPDGIAFLDAGTGHFLANRAFVDLLGKPIHPKEGVAQQLGILCRSDGRPLDLEDLPSMRAIKGETVCEELLLVRRDGRKIAISERAVPVRDPEGTLLGVVVVLRDITFQKDVERLHEEFAAMVAHDLRTPIQTMLFQVQLLKKVIDEGRPMPLGVLDRLERTSTSLARMAGDLLDATRVELARIPLDSSVVDVADATKYFVEHVRPVYGDHDVILHVADGVPSSTLDRVRFEQVLTNLLDNAARYSEKGTRIRIDVKPARGGVEIAVSDEGIGITPNEMPRLFDRFYQAQRARAQKGGLGLGLYITKGLVQAQGGTITVESRVDHGTTFRIWFPDAHAGAPDSASLH